jgi:hypothetical protein
MSASVARCLQSSIDMYNNDVGKKSAHALSVCVLCVCASFVTCTMVHVSNDAHTRTHTLMNYYNETR